MARRSKSSRRREESRATTERAHVGISGIERRFVAVLIAICLAAVLMRVVILTEYVRENPLAQAPLNDAAVYWEWAGRIADGQLTDETPFFSAPLYPYLLGALRAVGGTLVTVYVVQILLDITTACLLASVCWRRFGAAVGLLAAGLFLLLLEPASSSLRILASSLHLLLVTVLWSVLTRVEARGSVGNHVLVGIALGLLCLAYAPALLLLGLVPAWLVWSLRGQLRQICRAGVALGVALVVIAPATIHNWWVSGDFFPVQAVSGITLRLGNHEGATGVYAELPGVSIQRDRMHADAARVYRKATGKEPTWKAVDSYFRGEALRFWRQDPRRFVRLAAAKTWGFLASRVYGDIYQPAGEIEMGIAGWLRLAPVPTPWLMGPALVGLVVLLRQPRKHGPEWLLLLVPLVVVAAYWYSPRFRIPAIPSLVIMSAYAFAWALRGRRVSWQAGVVCAALVASIGTALINRGVGVDYQPGFTHFNVGSALLRLDPPRSERAEEVWREGLRLAPRDVTRRVSLADFLARQGRRREAVAEFQRAAHDRPEDLGIVRHAAMVLCQQKWYADARPMLARLLMADPDDLQIRTLLAAAEAASGDYAAALTEYEELMRREPDDPAHAHACGNVLIRLERWAEAKTMFEKVVAARPESVDAHVQLGGIAIRLGDLSLAREQFELARQVEPENVTVLYNLGAVDFKEGLLEAAAERFREVLAIDPAYARAQNALRQIEALQRSQNANP